MTSLQATRPGRCPTVTESDSGGVGDPGRPATAGADRRPGAPPPPGTAAPSPWQLEAALPGTAAGAGPDPGVIPSQSQCQLELECRSQCQVRRTGLRVRAGARRRAAPGPLSRRRSSASAFQVMNHHRGRDSCHPMIMMMPVLPSPGPAGASPGPARALPEPSG